MELLNSKFRCSMLKELMTEPRFKSETLSETTKSFLRDFYIEKVYRRLKTDLVANKYTRKGIMVETDSITLLEDVMGTKYFKNIENWKNDYITGTPDVVTEGEVIDIKSSWDIWTFSGSNEKTARDNYYWQLLGYMALTGKKKAKLAYVLSNTPDDMIADEFYRLSFYMPDEEAEQYRKNYLFDDIPPKDRVKIYDFEYSQEDYDRLIVRIEEARKYLVEMKL